LIEPSCARPALAFLALGATFITIGTLWCLVVAFGASRLRMLLGRCPGVRTIQDRATGVVFLALGLRLASARS
jgi:threonine/homoserine/homoserine lactone efflux protein